MENIDFFGLAPIKAIPVSAYYIRMSSISFLRPTLNLLNGAERAEFLFVFLLLFLYAEQRRNMCVFINRSKE
jgi:hypothetical protein